MIKFAVGSVVRLHVWGGDGYAVIEGTVEAVEPSQDFPGSLDEMIVILAEDDANAYRAGDIVKVLSC